MSWNNLLLDRVLVGLARFGYFALNSILRILRFLFWPGKRPVAAASVCVFRIGNVGDTICAFPALSAIHDEYPRARLVLLTSPGRGLPGAKEVFSAVEWIEIVEFFPEELSSRREIAKFLSLVRAYRFDVFIELSSDLTKLRHTLRNMIFARLAGVRWAGGWSINTLRFAAQQQSIYMKFPNEVERLLRDVAACGIKIPEGELPLPVTAEQGSRAAAIMNDAGVPAGTGLVALAPGAKRPVNRWPTERFVEVGRELTRLGYYILILGAESEWDSAEGIRGSIGVSCANLAGRIDLTDIPAVLKHCSLLVCNDSGLQHAASAVGTPCVTIFSSRDLVGKWRPHHARSVMLRRMVPCHTCYVEECPNKNRCLTEINSAEVAEAALGILLVGQIA